MHHGYTSQHAFSVECHKTVEIASLNNVAIISIQTRAERGTQQQGLHDWGPKWQQWLLFFTDNKLTVGDVFSDLLPVIISDPMWPVIMTVFVFLFPTCRRWLSVGSRCERESGVVGLWVAALSEQEGGKQSRSHCRLRTTSHRLVRPTTNS